MPSGAQSFQLSLILLGAGWGSGKCIGTGLPGKQTARWVSVGHDQQLQIILNRECAHICWGVQLMQQCTPAHSKAAEPTMHSTHNGTTQHTMHLTHQPTQRLQSCKCTCVAPTGKLHLPKQGRSSQSHFYKPSGAQPTLQPPLSSPDLPAGMNELQQLTPNP